MKPVNVKLLSRKYHADSKYNKNHITNPNYISIQSMKTYIKFI
jgi:hypothetical protein